MSDAGDEINVEEAAPEVEESSTAPKGKLSVEDALQVSLSLVLVLLPPDEKSDNLHQTSTAQRLLK